MDNNTTTAPEAVDDGQKELLQTYSFLQDADKIKEKAEEIAAEGIEKMNVIIADHKKDKSPYSYISGGTYSLK